MSAQPPPGHPDHVQGQSSSLMASGASQSAPLASGQPSEDKSSYSRFVSAMKVLLPALAAILVLTVFISTGTFNSRDELAITFQEVGALNDDLRMVSPHITGVDRKGRPYVVTANTATQAADEPNLIYMDNVEADLMLDTGGDWVSVSSRFGTLQSDEERLVLREKVVAFFATGYEFHAEEVTIDLNKGTLASDQPVYGQGPAGTLNANGVDASGYGDTIRFTGGVRVVIFYKSG